MNELTERIDHWLQTTIIDREMFSKGEVRDMLLDLRILSERELEPA